MKVTVSEVEIDFSEEEKRLLENYAGVSITPRNNSPAQVRYYKQKVGKALQEDLPRAERVSLLRLRQTLGEVVEGIEQAERGN